jgi:hypothetical protein
MIAAGIIGLVGMMAALNLRNKIPGYHLDQAVSTLATELQACRVAARSQARRVVLAIDPTRKTLTSSVDRNDNGVFDPGEISVLDLSRFDDVSIRSSDSGGVFGSRGTFSCPGGYWCISLSVRGGTNEYVYVFPSGQVERSDNPL